VFEVRNFILDAGLKFLVILLFPSWIDGFEELGGAQKMHIQVLLKNLW